ncbi:hypothetical protein [Protofrankia symbiont of Coriaria ruscifolia]|uniref:hypothetical protein n=1 Tax=Protofrankia symbiont of Coriaria ruscifolia TaxID=1306542 RepID=UPI001A947A83|nr:hypothetical protein [Protofrankia symbiont of Coriaria ruscifolia]
MKERRAGWPRPSHPRDRAPRTAGIGRSEIERIEHASRTFRAWDNQFGGGLRRKAVVGQLAATAATMSWDSGQGGIAQRYYLLALRAATAADDPAFRANILAGMARQQYYLGRVAEGLELVRLAQDSADGRATLAVRAMLSTRVRVKLAEFYRHAETRTSARPVAELCARIKPVLRAAPAN